MPLIVEVGNPGDVIFFHRCQYNWRSKDEFVLTCGKCMRGLIEPVVGYQCRVCGVVVLRVYDPS